MDPLNVEAIASLRSTITSFLPPVPNPSHSYIVSISEANVKPAGIGGFIGLHPDPEGELHGRRIEASLIITTSAPNATQPLEEYATVVDSLLALGQGELRAQGILKMTMTRPSEQLDLDTSTRDLQLDIVFEYLKLPETAEETIDTIPLNVVLD